MIEIRPMAHPRNKWGVFLVAERKFIASYPTELQAYRFAFNYVNDRVRAWTYPITNETEVSLVNDDGSIEWTGPFADFCASNKLENGEIEEIEYFLHNEGEFVDGGGSLAMFRLKLGA